MRAAQPKTETPSKPKPKTKPKPKKRRVVNHTPLLERLLVDKYDAARVLSCSARYVDELRDLGKITPVPMESKRMVRYLVEDLKQFLKEQLREREREAKKREAEEEEEGGGQQ